MTAIPAKTTTIEPITSQHVQSAKEGLEVLEKLDYECERLDRSRFGPSPIELEFGPDRKPTIAYQQAAREWHREQHENYKLAIHSRDCIRNNILMIQPVINTLAVQYGDEPERLSNLTELWNDRWPQQIASWKSLYREARNFLAGMARKIAHENEVAEIKPQADATLLPAANQEVDKPTLGLAIVTSAIRSKTKLTITKLAKQLNVDRQELYDKQEYETLRRFANEHLGLFKQTAKLGDWKGARGSKDRDTARIEAEDYRESDN